LRQLRREPRQPAGAHILQAANQRARRTGQEGERLHRAAGCQRKEHPGTEEEERGGHH